jgi:dihydrolipoamide dehydrogenase
MEKFDVVVIGAGPGGYPAAIRAAQLGASVAVVERERLGGTCLNWGCIPTKTLIAGGERYWQAKHDAALGLKTNGVGYDYAAMAKRKDEVVATLRNGVGQLLKGNGVKVFEGVGSFDAPNRIAVAGPDGKTKEMLQAGGVIVATGSESAMPGFIPRHARVLESRGFLDLTALPRSLLVLGGGVIGCEFACLAAQLGVSVTVVELLEDILVMLDADVRRELKQHMTKAFGIEILTGQALQDIQAGDAGVKGKVGERVLEADILLASVGRRPVTAGLRLENAGLRVNKAGFIETDDCGHTKAGGVYAIGDVTAGSTLLAHGATAQGVVAAENLCSGKRRTNDKLVPACIFTAPEIGTVGLTEQQAAAQNRPVKVGKFPFAALGKALASGEASGFAKWVVDAATDRLVGAQVVGPHATDLIGEAALAIRAELTAEELGRTIHCHPTFAEAWMEAAHAVHGTCIHAAPRRRRA